MGAVFGISDEACDRASNLLKWMHERVYSQRIKVEQMKNLATTEPYVYTLIHCCIVAIEESNKCLVVGNLPYHYRQAQLESLQKAYPELDGGVHELSTCLIYCKYCETLFVRVRTFDDPDSVCVPPTTSSDERTPSASGMTHVRRKQANKTFHLNQQHPRQTETHYLKMYIDLNAMCTTTAAVNNNEWLECYRKRRGAKEGCKDNQLCRVSMLGRIIKFKDMLIIMCPSCTFDPSMCAYTSIGVVCSYCTKNIEQRKFKRKSQITVELGIFKDPTQKTCDCKGCGSTLSNASSMYIYPFGIVLCSSCHNELVELSVQLIMDNSDGEKNYDVVMKAIVDILAARRQDMETAPR